MVTQTTRGGKSNARFLNIVFLFLRKDFSFCVHRCFLFLLEIENKFFTWHELMW